MFVFDKGREYLTPKKTNVLETCMLIYVIYVYFINRMLHRTQIY